MYILDNLTGPDATMRISHRMILRSALPAAILAALVGRTPTVDEPAEEPSPSATAEEPQASPEPEEPQVPVFVAPTSCTELLGSELEAEFLDGGNVLFSDSNGDGMFSDELIGQDGGDPFGCLYGQDGVELNTFELSAQPLSTDEHEGVLAEFGTRGLVEESDGERVSFAQEGDEGTDPAILHVVYPDGWITGCSTVGGVERSAELAGWVETVTTQVYPTR